MDESSQTHNRRERRSNVLLTAIIELSGRTLDVKLRNLSAEGALVEGESLPIEGTEITFRRGELSVPGRIVWVNNRRAGVHFHTALTPEALLRHVPTPRPRILPAFRRPGLGAKPLTSSERRFEQQWIGPVAHDHPGD